jgi:hypothetical protein
VMFERCAVNVYGWNDAHSGIVGSSLDITVAIRHVEKCESKSRPTCCITCMW